MNEFWKFCIRMGIVGLLVCFGIFYGVDLAANGLSETGGRIGAVDSAVSDERTDESERQQTETYSDHAGADSYPYEPPYDPLTPAQEPTLISVLADVTGDVLQRTARGGIELIVSLFDGILH